MQGTSDTECNVMEFYPKRIGGRVPPLSLGASCVSATEPKGYNLASVAQRKRVANLAMTNQPFHAESGGGKREHVDKPHTPR